MASFNPVGWFEIYVNDLARARAFYQTVLAVEIVDLPMDSDEFTMAAFPMNGEVSGASGALVHMPGMEAGGNSTIVYFSCEDCAVEESRVAAAGGEVFKSKFSIGEYGFISLVFDTERNMFGLHSQK